MLEKEREDKTLVRESEVYRVKVEEGRGGEGDDGGEGRGDEGDEGEEALHPGMSHVSGCLQSVQNAQREKRKESFCFWAQSSPALHQSDDASF
ncbi:hypothetical protein EYF80_065946 [Liparis tanakae]|uniref:Uncharacterized protein n=1 Tax=Liparis tanakae TaxID=230148 RepID=A0A4Z2E590_9TELE|nr:hypothetical protein EYF80_065946 [Liparis tanakae]